MGDAQTQGHMGDRAREGGGGREEGLRKRWSFALVAVGKPPRAGQRGEAPRVAASLGTSEALSLQVKGQQGAQAPGCGGQGGFVLPGIAVSPCGAVRFVEMRTGPVRGRCGAGALPCGPHPARPAL